MPSQQLHVKKSSQNFHIHNDSLHTDITASSYQHKNQEGHKITRNRLLSQ